MIWKDIYSSNSTNQNAFFPFVLDTNAVSFASKD